MTPYQPLSKLEEIDRLFNEFDSRFRIFESISKQGIWDDEIAKYSKAKIELKKALSALLTNIVIEVLEDIVKTAPTTPLHRDDRYYFDIGYEVDKCLKLLKGEKEHE